MDRALLGGNPHSVLERLMIGGGIPGEKKFKAMQTGGPSGDCGCVTYFAERDPIVSTPTESVSWSAVRAVFR